MSADRAFQLIAMARRKSGLKKKAEPGLEAVVAAALSGSDSASSRKEAPKARKAPKMRAPPKKRAAPVKGAPKMDEAPIMPVVAEQEAPITPEASEEPVPKPDEVPNEEAPQEEAPREETPKKETPREETRPELEPKKPKPGIASLAFVPKPLKKPPAAKPAPPAEEEPPQPEQEVAAAAEPVSESAPAAEAEPVSEADFGPGTVAQESGPVAPIPEPLAPTGKGDAGSMMKVFAVLSLLGAVAFLAYYFISLPDNSFIPGAEVDAETFKGIFQDAGTVFIVMDVRGAGTDTVSTNIMQCGVDFAASSGMGGKAVTPLSFSSEGCWAPDGNREAKECFAMLRNGLTIYVKDGPGGAKYYENGMMVTVGPQYSFGQCGIKKV